MNRIKRDKHPLLRDMYDSALPFWQNIRRLVKRILRQKQTPDEIASGFALGLFLAFAAPPGLQLLPAVALASVMGWNVLAAAAAVFVSNPLTMPVIYPLATYIGSYVTGLPIRGAIPMTDEGFWAFAADFRAHGRVLLLLSVGCVLLGSAASLIGYVATKRLVLVGRRILEERRAMRIRMGIHDSDSDADSDSDPDYDGPE